MARFACSRWLAYVLVLPVLGLAACGGGGGGGGAAPQSGPEELLSGAYTYIALVRPAVGSVQAHTGGISADGAGGLTISDAYVVAGGSSSGPLAATTTTYTVAADRTLGIAGLAGVPLAGRVSDDGASAVLTSAVPNDPAWALLVRRATSPSLASIAGSWSVLQWQREPAPSVVSSSAASATISAAGLLSPDPTNYIYNLDGAVNPVPVILVEQQLSIQPGGWVQASMPGLPGFVSRGALSADGNVLVLGGDFSSTALASATLLVRRGLASGMSALNGTYQGYGFSIFTSGYVAAAGPASFDGAGNGNWSYGINFNGAARPPAGFAFEYAVLAGVLDLRPPGGGGQWLGTVGAGGRLVIATGNFVTGADPTLVAFVR